MDSLKIEKNIPIPAATSEDLALEAQVMAAINLVDAFHEWVMSSQKEG